MSIYTLFPKFYQVLMAAILDAIINNWPNKCDIALVFVLIPIRYRE